MSTQTLGNGVTFHYTDSGLPADSNYSTIFIVHGHSFNSEYHGSTPHTPEELRVINSGTDGERADYIAEQCLLLALLFDGLIQKLSLPINIGGAISGWSLGNMHTLTVINAIDHPKLPPEAKERLKAFIRTYIIWEVPSQILGIESPPNFYFPCWDTDLRIEERGPVFGTYISSCCDHGADVLASHDISRLNHRTPTPGTSTIDKMTQEEIQSSTNFLAGSKCDTIVLEPTLYEIHRANVQKALLDPNSNVDQWGMNVWHIYGDNCSWNVILAAWVLEEKGQKANKENIKFKVIEGTNHFLMWEDLERAITVLKECMGF